ncbi:MAG: DNA-binding response regulator [Bacteroidetes bacterium GWE2_39_28]|nr:MAG: DNA-binding response regulator [Bacteroidetes bacterium GWE2_39_28]OFY12024.1 MAG: DNA-binding response regulator [Bacteroidetes bacterium GWF2_39_10]OFZ07126.1 MAG: DNA-binding response regulator [Bacteroidetes bacterium RIFOXYB2_FULL_39_7]OFZ11279.1 MAG: DNA-binding response regulator [Bacteroidetes bacterium RIFOXYC2_FULL_39_11]HCT95128.1 DNA-binding response regulator [Rikenellaceae bacterium]
MRVLIIEDEVLAAERLEEMLYEIDPSVKVVAKIGSISESVEWLKANNADLIFLDIQLSDGLSFTIFDEIKVSSPVIFTTTFDQYAIKAFDLNSIAYLLKPISHKKLEESIQKFKSLKTAFAIDIAVLSEMLNRKEGRYKERILLQIGQNYKKIEVSDIAYFYAVDSGIYVRTFSGTSYPIDFPLEKVESMFNPEMFFRINRKLIISHKSIGHMIAYSRGRIKITLNPEIEDELDAIVSINKSGEFKKWMDK